MCISKVQSNRIDDDGSCKPFRDFHSTFNHSGWDSVSCCRRFALLRSTRYRVPRGRRSVGGKRPIYKVYIFVILEILKIKYVFISIRVHRSLVGSCINHGGKIGFFFFFCCRNRIILKYKNRIVNRHAHVVARRFHAYTYILVRVI